MKILALLVITILGSTSYANSKIGPAGCGLGSVVFGAQKGMIQVVAATLNSTGLQTFGITSGTSNCDVANTSAKLNLYIETNRFVLATDISKGRGESLSNLSELLGCESQSEIGNILKSNYESIFPNQEVTAPQISSKIINYLQSHKAQCSGLT